MNDNQQQNQTLIQGQAPFQQPVVQQSPSPFGGGVVPYANIPTKKEVDMANVVYGPTNPEGQPIKVEKQADVIKAPEGSQEIQKFQENKPEKIHPAEVKEIKPVYPQNKQNLPVAPVAGPAQPIKPVQAAPKFFGYMVSPQIANNYDVISSLKGKGDPKKSRTWIYMLLDRILKKQTYLKNHKV
jgi:hypothetical protein